jgi:hypothetical protein
MRTTIRIQDELYRRAKSRAAESGRTVGEFIEAAVRDALEERSARPPRRVPALPVYGDSGLMPGVDLSSHVALLDLMDEDVPLDARR